METSPRREELCPTAQEDLEQHEQRLQSFSRQGSPVHSRPTSPSQRLRERAAVEMHATLVGDGVVGNRESFFRSCLESPTLDHQRREQEIDRMHRKVP